MLVGIAVTFALVLAMPRTRGRESLRPGLPVNQQQFAPPDQDDGNAVARLTVEEQEEIGLRTTEVRRGTVYRELITPARIEEVETAIRTISPLLGGRIDRLLVNTGQQVQKGQPVALVYNADLVMSAEEHKSAVENRRRLAGSLQADELTRADARVAASRLRLEQMLGLNSAQIEDILSSSEVPIHFTVYADATGIVRTRNVTEGRFVGAGEVLFVLVDLRTVWARTDIFQSDIGLIHAGLSAQITTETTSEVKLRGSVNFIESRSDPQTGTTPVRIQLENPEMRLRPGMLVRAALMVPVGINVLKVPRTAIIDIGGEKIVYLALDGGVFKRRRVQIGVPGNDYYPVAEGLMEGDKVVTNGAFLIDSQARMTSGMPQFNDSHGSSSTIAAPSGSVAENAYSLTFQTDPDPPLGGRENDFRVTVLDSAGKPVPDAEVRITLIMPAMPSMGMPEMRSSAALRWTGSEYLGPLHLGSGGPWNVSVQARRGLQVLAEYRTHFNAR